MERARRFNPNKRMQISESLIVECLRFRRRGRHLFVYVSNSLPERHWPLENLARYPDRRFMSSVLGLGPRYGCAKKANRGKREPRENFDGAGVPPMMACVFHILRRCHPRSW